MSDGLYTHYDWFIDWEKQQRKDAEKDSPVIKCECGSTITMGKDDHPTFHNDDCPIRIKYEKETNGK